MNTGTKIGLASAFGAFAGGTVAWYAHHAWWAVLLGLIVGALAGYLSYEWRTVLPSVRNALLTELKLPKWHKECALKILPEAIMFTGCTYWFLFVSILAWKSAETKELALATWIITQIAVVAILFVIAGLDGNFSGLFDDKKKAWKWALRLNTIALPVTVLCYIALLVCKIVRKIFIAIHCEERVQSAFYAAVGVLVGHFTSHAFIGVLIGAVVGFVLGSVSYKLISVRLLKPARA